MMSTQPVTGSFVNKDGLEIFHQRWPVEDPAAALLLVHGLGEHSGRYGNLINAMEKEPVSFFALDHQGHGRSGGKRGHVNDFADYTADVKQFVDQVIRPQVPDRPLVCLGHSMGGLIAAHFALRHQADLNALVLSAPAFQPGSKVPAFQAAAARIVSRILPRLTQSNQLNPADLSHDPATVQAYLADPLVHDRISTRWFVSFLATAGFCLDHAAELTLPLLVIHGAADRMVNPEGSRQFYEQAGSSDKTLRIFDGLFHETMNEAPADREAVLAVLTGWIREKIPLTSR
ncbi:MAG: lysophospholipase [Desulfosudaceae bacterium]